MNYPKVIVNGVSVRVDSAGRYSLNDLHSAAVLKGEANESQKPSKFIRSASVKRFVSALDSRGQKSPLKGNQSLKVIKGGNEKGVWAAELLAIRYAAWIKPEFEISVYETFREATLNEISNMTMLNRLDLLIATEKQEISHCARKMNLWGSEAVRNLYLTLEPILLLKWILIWSQSWKAINNELHLRCSNIIHG